MNTGSEYTVKRIDTETFELWRADELLATMTREEAWPVMMGRVHPSSLLEDEPEGATPVREGNTKR